LDQVGSLLHPSISPQLEPRPAVADSTVIRLDKFRQAQHFSQMIVFNKKRPPVGGLESREETPKEGSNKLLHGQYCAALHKCQAALAAA
jgi:hypothetical protein